MPVKKIRSMKDLESLPEGEWVEAEFEKGSIKFVEKKPLLKAREK